MSEKNTIESFRSPSDASCISEDEKKKILERKCPNCGEPIQQYHFTCTLLPLELEAMIRIPAYSKTSTFAFLSNCKIAAFSQHMIHISAVCINCQLISTWFCDDVTLKFIRSDEGKLCGLSLVWMYNPKMWEKFCEQITDRRTLKEVEEVTEAVQVAYKGWGME